MIGVVAWRTLSRTAKVALLSAYLSASAAWSATALAKSSICPLPARFFGVLSCAHCRGIRQQIDLLPNSKFVQTVERLREGDSQQDELSYGIWWISADGGTLTLDAGSDANGQDVRSVWRLSDARTLRMLVDERGDSIASNLDFEVRRVDSLPAARFGQPPEFQAPLANTRWVPRRIAGRSVTATARQQEQWIVLDQRTRRVTGLAGCCEITGIYDVGLRTLRIRGLVPIRRTCPDLEGEAAFLKVLHRTWGYRVAGRRLELLDRRDAVLADLEERNQ